MSNSVSKKTMLNKHSRNFLVCLDNKMMILLASLTLVAQDPMMLKTKNMTMLLKV